MLCLGKSNRAAFYRVSCRDLCKSCYINMLHTYVCLHGNGHLTGDRLIVFLPVMEALCYDSVIPIWLHDNGFQTGIYSSLIMKACMYVRMCKHACHPGQTVSVMR